MDSDLPIPCRPIYVRDSRTQQAGTGVRGRVLWGKAVSRHLKLEVLSTNRRKAYDQNTVAGHESYTFRFSVQETRLIRNGPAVGWRPSHEH